MNSVSGNFFVSLIKIYLFSPKSTEGLENQQKKSEKNHNKQIICLCANAAFTHFAYSKTPTLLIYKHGTPIMDHPVSILKDHICISKK